MIAAGIPFSAYQVIQGNVECIGNQDGIADGRTFPAVYIFGQLAAALGLPLNDVISPVYYPFSFAVRRNERKEVRCPLVNINGRYEIDYELLEEMAGKPENKLIIFCSPHNPVGRVWTRDELERVGRICIDNDVFIVSNEIHCDLIMPGYEHTVMANISRELEGYTMTCIAPSKTFNLAGDV